MEGSSLSLEEILSGCSSSNVQIPSSSTLSTGRTPLKDRMSFFNAGAPSARSSVISCNSSNNNSGSATDLMESLMKGRIEHLERERVELSLQLQKKEESLRSRKLKLDALESQIKTAESSRVEVQKKYEELRDSIGSIQSERDVLRAELVRLKEQYQTQQTAEVQAMWNKMTATTREMRQLEEINEKLTNERDALLAEKTSLSEALQASKMKAEEEEAQVVELTRAIEESNALVAQLDTQIEEEKQNAKAAAERAANERIELVGQIERERIEFQAEKTGLLKQINIIKTQLEEAQNAKSTTMAICDEAGLEDENNVSDENVLAAIRAQNNKQLLSLVQSLREKLFDSEAKRKKLHNSLQELRGNIRVYVRCRPFLKYDGDESMAIAPLREQEEKGCVKCHKDGASISLSGSTRGNGQLFTFDHVFKMDTTQEDIYKEVSELVQSALDGYKVCIFSYGQTGSGKTHTMTGDYKGPSRGIIPRAVEQVISNVIAMQKDGWDISVSASIVELYNEELRDLLPPGPNSAAAAALAAAGGKLKISYQHGRVSVAGLNAIDINTSDLQLGMHQLQCLLDQSNRVRATASTGMNETSSRSHALFMLDISGKHSDGVTFMRGGLRLVDLAGSERLDRTGTANDSVRLKETVNINKSLSCLADVFVALSNKAPHIPFRNSKLTMLLQDCLSGDGKSLMFVNVSPTQPSVHETLCSLRFAQQVSQVELGKASKSIFIAPSVAAANVVASTSSSSTSSSSSTASSSASSTLEVVAPTANVAPAPSLLGAPTRKRSSTTSSISSHVSSVTMSASSSSGTSSSTSGSAVPSSSTSSSSLPSSTTTTNNHIGDHVAPALKRTRTAPTKGTWR